MSGMPERIWAWEHPDRPEVFLARALPALEASAATEYLRADLAAHWVPADEWLAKHRTRAVQTVIARLGGYDPYRGAAYHDGFRWRTLDDDVGDDEVLYVLDGVPEVPR